MRKTARLIWKKVYTAFLMGLIFIVPFDQLWPAGLCADTKTEVEKTFQKGVCYASWEKNRYLSPYSDKSLETLTFTGANCVSIVTTWYQKNAQWPHIYPTENTPTDRSLRHVIRKAKELGLAVMLKPHVDLIDTSDGAWRGDIFFYKEEGWQKWFSDYKKFITHYARLAKETGVDIFCIGTELSGTVEQTAEWLEVIELVRSIYGGRLTYAANWDGEFQRVKFWNELDFAGVDAYFPLAKDLNPTFDQLKETCDKWLKDVESWARPLGKPILFTEVGYSSTQTAALKPWEERSPGGTDLRIQRDCYKALLETVWGREWLAGIYWWRWNATPNAGGPNNKGYTPQNKPAQEVLAEWYKR